MRTLRLLTLAFGFALALALPAAAGPFPGVISLPNGFRPEGISIGGAMSRRPSDGPASAGAVAGAELVTTSGTAG